MATKTKQDKAAPATALTWARANRLAELANIKSSQARSFLTTVDDEIKELLDTNADKRNGTIRQLIAQARNTISKGDPLRPPRAGKPQPVTVGPNILKKDTTVNIDLLLDLKKLIDKYGSLNVISDGVATYKKLCE